MTLAMGLSSDIIAALDSIIANNPNNVQVINMSLGTDALFEGVCDDADCRHHDL